MAASIERWWELVFSAYLLVSLQAENFQTLADEPPCVQSTQLTAPSRLIAEFQQHRWWEHGTTWNSALNNIRLIIQPFLFDCLISPWLEVFKLTRLQRSFDEFLQILDSFPARGI